MTMPKSSCPLTVIYAKDLQRLAGFYQAVLGLKRTDEDQSFVVLDTDAFEIVVIQAPVDIANSIEMASPPVVREDNPIKVSFSVSSIEALRSTVQQFGGALKPTPATWSWRGTLHLDGHDPEGNVFQLRQSAA